MTIGLAVITYSRQDLLPGFAAGAEGDFVGKLVVNNGPASACAPFATTHPDWFVLDGQNSGCCGGFNRALAYFAAADAVILCCDDITVPPGQMAALVEDIRAHHLTHDMIFGHEYACFGFTRRGINRVGLFDENFWPGYHGDIDHQHRGELLGAVIRQAPCVLTHQGSASFRAKPPGVHKTIIDEGAAYYRRKWGRAMGDSTTEPMWSTPFNAGGPVNDWQLESPSMRDRLKHL